MSVGFASCGGYGTGQYVDLTLATDNNGWATTVLPNPYTLTATTGLAFSLWIKQRDANEGFMLMTLSNNEQTKNDGIFIKISANKLFFKFYSSTGTDLCPQSDSLNVPINLNAWTHYAYSFQASTRTLNVWKNGQGAQPGSTSFVCSNTIPSVSRSWATLLKSDSSGMTDWLVKAELGHFAIWEKFLSTADVTTLFQSGTPLLSAVDWIQNPIINTINETFLCRTCSQTIQLNAPILVDDNQAVELNLVVDGAASASPSTLIWNTANAIKSFTITPSLQGADWFRIRFEQTGSGALQRPFMFDDLVLQSSDLSSLEWSLPQEPFTAVPINPSFAPCTRSYSLSDGWSVSASIRVRAAFGTVGAWSVRLTNGTTLPPLSNMTWMSVPLEMGANTLQLISSINGNFLFTVTRKSSNLTELDFAFNARSDRQPPALEQQVSLLQSGILYYEISVPYYRESFKMRAMTSETFALIKLTPPSGAAVNLNAAVGMSGSGTPSFYKASSGSWYGAPAGYFPLSVGANDMIVRSTNEEDVLIRITRAAQDMIEIDALDQSESLGLARAARPSTFGRLLPLTPSASPIPADRFSFDLLLPYSVTNLSFRVDTRVATTPITLTHGPRPGTVLTTLTDGVSSPSIAMDETMLPAGNRMNSALFILDNPQDGAYMVNVTRYQPRAITIELQAVYTDGTIRLINFPTPFNYLQTYGYNTTLGSGVMGIQVRLNVSAPADPTPPKATLISTTSTSPYSTSTQTTLTPGAWSSTLQLASKLSQILHVQTEYEGVYEFNLIPQAQNLNVNIIGRLRAYNGSPVVEQDLTSKLIWADPDFGAGSGWSSIGVKKYNLAVTYGYESFDFLPTFTVQDAVGTYHHDVSIKAGSGSGTPIPAISGQRSMNYSLALGSNTFQLISTRDGTITINIERYNPTLSATSLNVYDGARSAPLVPVGDLETLNMKPSSFSIGVLDYVIKMPHISTSVSIKFTFTPTGPAAGDAPVSADVDGQPATSVNIASNQYLPPATHPPTGTPTHPTLPDGTILQLRPNTTNVVRLVTVDGVFGIQVKRMEPSLYTLHVRGNTSSGFTAPLTLGPFFSPIEPYYTIAVPKEFQAVAFAITFNTGQVAASVPESNAGENGETNAFYSLFDATQRLDDGIAAPTSNLTALWSGQTTSYYPLRINSTTLFYIESNTDGVYTFLFVHDEVVMKDVSFWLGSRSMGATNPLDASATGYQRFWRDSDSPSLVPSISPPFKPTKTDVAYTFTASVYYVQDLYVMSARFNNLSSPAPPTVLTLDRPSPAGGPAATEMQYDTPSQTVPIALGENYFRMHCSIDGDYMFKVTRQSPSVSSMTLQARNASAGGPLIEDASLFAPSPALTPTATAPDVVHEMSVDFVVDAIIPILTYSPRPSAVSGLTPYVSMEVWGEDYFHGNESMIQQLPVYASGTVPVLHPLPSAEAPRFTVPSLTVGMNLLRIHSPLDGQYHIVIRRADRNMKSFGLFGYGFDGRTAWPVTHTSTGQSIDADNPISTDVHYDLHVPFYVRTLNYKVSFAGSDGPKLNRIEYFNCTYNGTFVTPDHFGETNVTCLNNSYEVIVGPMVRMDNFNFTVLNVTNHTYQPSDSLDTFLPLAASDSAPNVLTILSVLDGNYQIRVQRAASDLKNLTLIGYAGIDASTHELPDPLTPWPLGSGVNPMTAVQTNVILDALARGESNMSTSVSIPFSITHVQLPISFSQAGEASIEMDMPDGSIAHLLPQLTSTDLRCPSAGTSATNPTVLNSNYTDCKLVQLDVAAFVATLNCSAEFNGVPLLIDGQNRTVVNCSTETALTGTLPNDPSFPFLALQAGQHRLRVSSRLDGEYEYRVKRAAPSLTNVALEGFFTTPNLPSTPLNMQPVLRSAFDPIDANGTMPTFNVTQSSHPFIPGGYNMQSVFGYEIDRVRINVACSDISFVQTRAKSSDPFGALTSASGAWCGYTEFDFTTLDPLSSPPTQARTIHVELRSEMDGLYRISLTRLPPDLAAMNLTAIRSNASAMLLPLVPASLTDQPLVPVYVPGLVSQRYEFNLTSSYDKLDLTFHFATPGSLTVDVVTDGRASPPLHFEPQSGVALPRITLVQDTFTTLTIRSTLDGNYTVRIFAVAGYFNWTDAAIPQTLYALDSTPHMPLTPFGIVGASLTVTCSSSLGPTGGDILDYTPPDSTSSQSEMIFIDSLMKQYLRYTAANLMQETLVNITCTATGTDAYRFDAVPVLHIRISPRAIVHVIHPSSVFSSATFRMQVNVTAAPNSGKEMTLWASMRCQNVVGLNSSTQGSCSKDYATGMNLQPVPDAHLTLNNTQLTSDPSFYIEMQAPSTFAQDAAGLVGGVQNFTIFFYVTGSDASHYSVAALNDESYQAGVGAPGVGIFLYVRPQSYITVSQMPDDMSVLQSYSLTTVMPLAPPTTAAGFILTPRIDPPDTGARIVPASVFFSLPNAAQTFTIIGPPNPAHLTLSFVLSGSDATHYFLPTPFEVNVAPLGTIVLHDVCTEIAVGGSCSASVSLSEQPYRNGAVTLSAFLAPDGKLGTTTTLHFDYNNWMTPQTIIVNAPTTTDSPAFRLDDGLSYGTPLLDLSFVPSGMNAYQYARYSNHSILLLSQCIVTSLPATLYADQNSLPISVTWKGVGYAAVDFHISLSPPNFGYSSTSLISYSSTLYTKSFFVHAPKTMADGSGSSTLTLTFSLSGTDAHKFESTTFVSVLDVGNPTPPVMQSSTWNINLLQPVPLTVTGFPTRLYTNQRALLTFTLSESTTSGSGGFVLSPVGYLEGGIPAGSMTPQSQFTRGEGSAITFDLELTAPTQAGNYFLSFALSGGDAAHYVVEPRSTTIIIDPQVEFIMPPNTFPVDGLAIDQPLPMSMTPSLIPDAGVFILLTPKLTAGQGSFIPTSINFTAANAQQTQTILYVPPTSLDGSASMTVTIAYDMDATLNGNPTATEPYKAPSPRTFTVYDPSFIPDTSSSSSTGPDSSTAMLDSSSSSSGTNQSDADGGSSTGLGEPESSSSGLALDIEVIILLVSVLGLIVLLLVGIVCMRHKRQKEDSDAFHAAMVAQAAASDADAEKARLSTLTEQRARELDALAIAAHSDAKPTSYGAAAVMIEMASMQPGSSSSSDGGARQKPTSYQEDSIVAMREGEDDGDSAQEGSTIGVDEEEEEGITMTMAMNRSRQPGGSIELQVRR